MSEKKQFAAELEKFTKMLINKEPFSFQRFADGESWILQGRKFALGPKKRHHMYLNPEDWKSFSPRKNRQQREHLYRALRYSAPNYYLGLLVGNSPENHKLTAWTLEQSQQDISRVTFANLFVNSNYPSFVNNFVSEFKKWKIVIVCNEKSILDTEIFPTVVKRFDVGSNCIINDYKLVDELREYVVRNEIKDHLFLFACSTLGNFCIRDLAEIAPENTYIDCGSTLNPFLRLGTDRAYLSAYTKVDYRGGSAPLDALYEEETWPWSNQT